MRQRSRGFQVRDILPVRLAVGCARPRRGAGMARWLCRAAGREGCLGPALRTAAVVITVILTLAVTGCRIEVSSDPGTVGRQAAGRASRPPRSPRPAAPRPSVSWPGPAQRGSFRTGARFWSGTDSGGPVMSGPDPYRLPEIGGSPAYGGYIGMVGTWTQWLHCPDGPPAWSATDSKAANANYLEHHEGIGTAVYWFMAGAGLDPHYDGSTAEAWAWGAAQAAATLRAMARWRVTYPVVFMDVELPGSGAAPDNGWRHVYASPCSGRVRSKGIRPAVNRAELEGYRAYLTANSWYRPGVYSSPPIWKGIFGTGPASFVPTLDEWTYVKGTRALNPAPVGWCVPGTTTCAQFFGGVHRSSPQALIWQWSGGGGLYNGCGDFDQIRVGYGALPGAQVAVPRATVRPARGLRRPGRVLLPRPAAAEPSLTSGRAAAGLADGRVVPGWPAGPGRAAANSRFAKPRDPAWAPGIAWVVST